jgi:hypothetical protein
LHQAASSSPSDAPASPDEELVAVIAAAISAAGGLEPGAFRIAHLEETRSGTFNTPAWGHVDRFAQSWSGR